MATTDDENPPPLIDGTNDSLSPYLLPAADLTLYWKFSQRLWKSPAVEPALPEAIQDWVTKERQRSFNDTVRLNYNSEAPPLTSRACICSCFGGTYLSGTLRGDAPIAKRLKERKPASAEAWITCPTEIDSTKFLVETFAIVDQLWQMTIGSGNEIPHGLVIFAGATNVAKSVLAKSFCLGSIQQALSVRQMNVKQRFPHLVSFEDPIEKWQLAKHSEPTIPIPLDAPMRSIAYDFCFTPRQKSVDVSGLSDALLDAKRQTPTCFFVGEVRDEGEWRDILSFAGTGHLIVVTTHAASLNETMARLLSAVGATDSVRRREVGGRLLACVHLTSGEVMSRKAVFPSMWLRQGAALNSLVADGLSSVIPNQSFVWSHQRFMEELQSKMSAAASKAAGLPASNLEESLRKAVIEMARKFDLQELRRQ